VRDVAWAIVVLAGAVVFAAGLDDRGNIPSGSDGCWIGGIVAGAALLRLALFRYAPAPSERDD
jgi:hypothetical protein